MKGALAHTTKTVKKVKIDKADGEHGQAAKDDRLRISSFQGFWKTTLQNVYILKYLTEPKIEQHLKTNKAAIDLKKVCIIYSIYISIYTFTSYLCVFIYSCLNILG